MGEGAAHAHLVRYRWRGTRPVSCSLKLPACLALQVHINQHYFFFNVNRKCSFTVGRTKADYLKNAAYMPILTVIS